MIDLNYDMSQAHKDRPVLAYCMHEADPYKADEEGKRLTPYGAFCEGFSHVDDGWHVVEWVEGEYEYSGYSGMTSKWPDWWFRSGSGGQEAASPVCWIDIDLGLCEWAVKKNMEARNERVDV